VVRTLLWKVPISNLGWEFAVMIQAFRSFLQSLRINFRIVLLNRSRAFISLSFLSQNQYSSFYLSFYAIHVT